MPTDKETITYNCMRRRLYKALRHGKVATVAAWSEDR